MCVREGDQFFQVREMFKKKGIRLGKGGIKNPRETFKTRTVAFFWPDVSIAVVKFWHERSMFTLCSVGYKFGLSLGWSSFCRSDQCLYWVVLGTCLGLEW